MPRSKLQLPTIEGDTCVIESADGRVDAAQLNESASRLIQLHRETTVAAFEAVLRKNNLKYRVRGFHEFVTDENKRRTFSITDGKFGLLEVELVHQQHQRSLIELGYLVGLQNWLLIHKNPYIKSLKNICTSFEHFLKQRLQAANT